MEIIIKKSTVKNWWLFGILILLIILNIYSSLISIANKKTIKALNFKLVKEQLRSSCKDTLYRKQMETLLLVDQMFNRVAGNSFLDHNSKLLFLFNGSGCKQCILRILMDLNILADEIGRDKIVLVGDFDSAKTFNDYLYNINNGFSSVLLKEIGDVNAKIEKPILLILEPGGNPKFVFFNPDEVPSLKNIYFNEILKIYFKRDRSIN